MIYGDFVYKHLFTDSKTGKLSLYNLAIKGVKVGKEATDLAKLFDLRVSSLMLPSGAGLSGISHSEEYITFANQDGKNFVTTEDKPFSVPVYYYDGEISKIIKEIYKDYQLCTVEDEGDVEAMYELFGMNMEVNDNDL